MSVHLSQRVCVMEGVVENLPCVSSLVSLCDGESTACQFTCESV